MTSERFQAAVGVAVSLAGLAAYVYLLGGLVTWLRFTAARLPADEALGSVDAKQLLAIGFKALLFVVVLMLLLALVAWAAWRVARLTGKSFSGGDASSQAKKVSQQTPAAWAVILLGIGLGIAVAPIVAKHGHSLAGNTPMPLTSLVGGMIGAFVGALIDERPEKGWLESPWLKWVITAIAVGLALVCLSAPTGIAVLVFVGLAHFGGSLSQLPSVNNLTRLIPAVLILGACAGLVVAAYLATPPVSLDRATVLTDSGHLITGGYIGRDGDGVTLARCAPEESSPVVSRRSHLAVIPSSEVRSVSLGGHSYAFDYGRDPSIIDLGRYYFERDGISQLMSTASIDFRADRFVCGLKSSFLILGEEPKPHIGAAIEKVQLYGEGTIRLEGSGIAPVVAESDGRSKAWLPIMPVAVSLLARLHRAGSAVIRTRTSFEIEGQDTVTRTRDVRLHLTERKTTSRARRASLNPNERRRRSAGRAMAG